MKRQRKKVMMESKGSRVTGIPLATGGTDRGDIAHGTTLHTFTPLTPMGTTSLHTNGDALHPFRSMDLALRGP